MAALDLPRAGELNRRVLLRLQSETPNFDDALDQGYSGDLERWAKVEPVHGIANRAGAQVGEMPTHFVWLRYGAGTKPEELTASHVIEHKNRRYRVIDSIDANDARRFTRISVKDLGNIA